MGLDGMGWDVLNWDGMGGFGLLWVGMFEFRFRALV